MVIDPFNAMVDFKDIQAEINNNVIKTALNEVNYQDTVNTVESLSVFIDRLILELDIPMDRKELKIQDIVKLLSIHPVSEGDSFVERLCDLITIYSSYSECKLFVFVNLSNYLSSDEMASLGKSIMYSDTKVLFIESSCNNILNSVPVKIIDGDLCEINGRK